MVVNKVQTKNIVFGDNAIPFIGGPCVIESRDHCFGMAEQITEVVSKLNVPFIFKSSFDKANRTSISSYRGNGIEDGLKILEEIKNNFNIPVTTDIHLPEHANEVCDVVDIIQIPAFLCRQTDLLLTACLTGKIVNIKKGQFLAPWDMHGVLSKTKEAEEVWITERGTSFGYNTLVVDFTGIQYMLDYYDVPIVFDVTHSVQKPGGKGKSSGGNRDYVPSLARAASAMGVKNFFLEVHADPDNAPSDGSNMLRLEDFERTVNDIYRYSYTC